MEGREDQILALLAIAYWRAVPPSILENFRRAAKAYARGEKVIAHMHLAFTGLHGLEDEGPASLRLFLAERLLALGVSPRALLAALEIDQPKFEPALDKASPGDPKHPGWPAGTEGGVGGRFRPKDGDASDAESADERQKVEALIQRRNFRILLTGTLLMGGWAAIGFIPGAELISAYGEIAELVQMAAEFKQLKTDADAALAFAAHGPYDLDELRPPGAVDNEQFGSFNEFKKIQQTDALTHKRYGPAGAGYEYHHIVTQGGENQNNIPTEMLQNTENIISIPTIYHEAVNAAYSANRPGTNMSVYEWLQSQPYSVQREEGLQILHDLKIVK